MTRTAMAATGLPNHEPAIRVQSIEKSYKDLHVLSGVNFDVAPGSIFALLGSNGAGKTTIVRILSSG
jgi:ABC-2 type transport system ATP-binding protein